MGDSEKKSKKPADKKTSWTVQDYLMADPGDRR